MTPLNLLDAFGTARRHLGRLLLWAFAAGVAGYLIALVIPSSFKASAAILPPDDDDLTASLSSGRRSLAALGGLGRFSSYFTQADVALAILRSRGTFAAMVRQFDLQGVYHVTGEERAIRQLRAKTDIRIGTEGTIAVSVLDRSPQRAADLANAFFRELDRYNRESRSFRGRRTRQFLERRVFESDSTLHALESSLAAYQKVHGDVVLPADGHSGSDMAAAIVAEKLSAEVELELVRSYASSSSDEVQRLETRVRELRRQVGGLPGTQVGGAGLLRAIAVQQQVFAALTAQLEDARVREAMDTPTIQILDHATPPEIRAWPRRGWIALFGAFVGFALGLVQVSGLLGPIRRAT